MEKKAANSPNLKITLLVPAMLLTLSACATPFRADVSRFEALPAPTGQSFVIVAGDPELEGGLEFANYAKLVGQRMSELGYRQVDDPQQAELVVGVDYDIDNGRERVVSTGFNSFGFGGFHRSGFGHRGFGRGFRRGFGHRYRFGFHDPFLFGGHGFSGFGDIRSFTVYTAGLDLKIEKRETKERVFEGTAEAQSRSKSLPYLVPNLVEAMFTNFPGTSGETVRISVAPEKKHKKVKTVKSGKTL